MNGMTASRTSLRDRYLAFIERHEIAWEITFAILAVMFVIVGFAEESPAFEAIDWTITFIFLAEFTSRIAASYDRRAYLRRHWIDLTALIPYTRGLRMLRLARLLRLVRAFAGIYRVVASLESLAMHRGLALLIAAWGGVMVICSLAMYAAENGINNAITSPLDAIWWGVVTLTTVGYGDVTPITGEGRLAASVLMLLGIGLFSAITAIFTSFMMREQAKEPARTPADRLRDLEALRDEGLIAPDEYATKRPDLLDAL
jgi:voltage-gated potassium channel